MKPYRTKSLLVNVCDAFLHSATNEFHGSRELFNAWSNLFAWLHFFQLSFLTQRLGLISKFVQVLLCDTNKGFASIWLLQWIHMSVEQMKLFLLIQLASRVINRKPTIVAGCWLHASQVSPGISYLAANSQRKCCDVWLWFLKHYCQHECFFIEGSWRWPVTVCLMMSCISCFLMMSREILNVALGFKTVFISRKV